MIHSNYHTGTGNAIQRMHEAAQIPTAKMPDPKMVRCSLCNVRKPRKGGAIIGGKWVCEQDKGLI